MIIQDCKQCITYAMCRSELITRISKIQTDDLNFNVVGAYSSIVSSRCDVQRDALTNAVSYNKDNGQTPKETDNVVAMILQTFDIDKKALEYNEHTN